MANYTKTTNVAAKDALSPGNASKVVKGTEIDTEFTNISTAIATKAEADYEISRKDFYTNYQQLEKLLGKRLDTLVR